MQPEVSGPDTTTTFPSTTSAWIEEAPHEHGSSPRAVGDAAEALTAKTRTITTNVAIRLRDPVLTQIQRSSPALGYGRRETRFTRPEGYERTAR